MSDATRRLRQALDELMEIESLLDEYEETGTKRNLNLVTQKMKFIAPELKALSALDECMTKENKPLLLQLSAGMKESVSRVKRAAFNERSRKNAAPPSARSPHRSDEVLRQNSAARSKRHTVAGTAALSGGSDPFFSGNGSFAGVDLSFDVRGGFEPLHEKPTALAGWLRKQGEKGVFKIWKRRYFEQRSDEGQLDYFKRQGAYEACGHVGLSSIRRLVARVHDNRHYIDVHVSSGRVYKLLADSAKDMLYWSRGIAAWRRWQLTQRANAAALPRSFDEGSPLGTSRFSSQPTPTVHGHDGHDGLERALRFAASPSDSEGIASGGGGERSGSYQRGVLAPPPSPTSGSSATASHHSEPNYARYSGGVSSSSSSLLFDRDSSEPGADKGPADNNVADDSQSDSSESESSDQHEEDGNDDDDGDASGDNVRSDNARSDNVKELEEQVGNDEDASSASEQSNSEHDDDSTTQQHLKDRQIAEQKEQLEAMQRRLAELEAERDEWRAQQQQVEPVESVALSSSAPQPIGEFLASLAAVFTPEQRAIVEQRLLAFVDEFRTTEDQVALLKEQQEAAHEQIKLKDQRVRSLEQDRKRLERERDAKDRHIDILDSQLKEARGTSRYASVGAASSSSRHERRGRGGAGAGRDSEAPRAAALVAELRESCKAHQTQSAFLSAELTRVEQSSKAQLKAKDEHLDDLKRELADVRHAYQQLRKKALLAEGVDDDALSELEKVRKELFYALAVGIKLNLALNGTSCNVDIASMYEDARNIDYRRWNDWIMRQIERSSPSSSSSMSSSSSASSTPQRQRYERPQQHQYEQRSSRSSSSNSRQRSSRQHSDSGQRQPQQHQQPRRSRSRR
jgi:PH domain